MDKFRTGNVVKTQHGYIVIISNYTKDYTSWISFDFAGSSGGHKNEDEEVDETCWDCQENSYPNTECEVCGGTTTYKKIRRGFNHSTILASCVKDYIMTRLLKNFEF